MDLKLKIYDLIASKRKGVYWDFKREPDDNLAAGQDAKGMDNSTERHSVEY